VSVLDQPDRCASIDPKSMKSLLESFPEQVESAVQSGRDIRLAIPENINVLIVTGLGGSAIGGDLVRSVAGPQLRVPLLVNRDYDLPGYLNEHALVLACSYSGNTEETLSAYEQARDAKAAVVCITSGGRLASLAKEEGFPVLLVPGGLPPRAAMGYSLFTLLSALQALRFIPDMTAATRETISLLRQLRARYGTENPESDNPAKRLASSLHGKIVAVYGSNAILDAAAYRWRSQIAENSKNLAFHHVLPEMNHNELVGWRFPEDALRKVGVVFLRDREDHPQVQRRYDLTRELISGRAGVLHEIWSEGESLLARVSSTIYLGDFVSLYLAYLNNIDPTPVEVIDYLKRSLSTAESK
jgi:glucose/mannose-6-phosphate isomerase